MSANPRLSVVIPSWNSESLLKQNLPSVLKAAAVVQAEIIVVDDASTADNSVLYLTSLKDKITLLKHRTNLGFGATVNDGVNHAHGNIVVLLNTDVRPSPDCFIHLAKSFSDPKLFAITFNSDSGWARGVWERGLFHHFRQQPKDPQHLSLSASLFASGGQAAFDKHKWVALGGMDPMYAPFYWEDVDLGYRAWKRGWHIDYDPRCLVVHDHTSSVIATSFAQSQISSTAQRNQLLFIWKNIHDPKMILSHLLFLPRFIINYPGSFLAALARLPIALRSRGIEQRESVATDHEVLSNWT